VVFGHVIKGQEIVDQIQLYGDVNGRPSKKVMIMDSGCLRRHKIEKEDGKKTRKGIKEEEDKNVPFYDE
jgi:hypothetical protein